MARIDEDDSRSTDRSAAPGAVRPRTADPWRDLRVIDARAPRTNQAFVGLLSALGVATGSWPLLALVALQLTLSVTLGRRFCLPCLLYFEVIQPRLGEGPLEDSRPPRFANQVGATFLWAATGAALLGHPAIAAVLGGLVAALALLGATTGFCTGCAIYRAWAALRGRGCDAGCRIDAPGAAGDEG
jgi:hypothetical protein